MLDQDLTIMIYGAIMGVVGSILTSLVTTIFQFWLERREHERRQHEDVEGIRPTAASHEQRC